MPCYSTPHGFLCTRTPVGATDCAGSGKPASQDPEDLRWCCGTCGRPLARRDVVELDDGRTVAVRHFELLA
jgi:hypothetical protein